LPAFPRQIGKAAEGMGRIGTHLIHRTPVEPDISRHMYVCGETGVGKTTLLHNLMVQDIHDGKGFAFFDPHGDEAENLLNFIPQHRVKDVVYFAPHDRERPVTLNPLQKGVGEDHERTVQAIANAFRAIWPDTYGESSMQYILLSLLATAIHVPGATFQTARKILIQPTYRAHVLTTVANEELTSFWRDEWEKFSERDRALYSWSTRNKLGQFLLSPTLKNVLCGESSFSPKEIMNGRKIFIANLSIGHLGVISSRILGCLLFSLMQAATMERAKTRFRIPFSIYLDEFQNFVNPELEAMLSQARKYRVSLVLANQYLAQLPDDLKSAVFGNVGTIVSYRVGKDDAEYLSKHFEEYPKKAFLELDQLQSLARFLYEGNKHECKINADEYDDRECGRARQVIDNSRERYGRKVERRSLKTPLVWSGVGWKQ
jgi:type IV secretory pathway TraG/TraD family ATPase VirD4